MLKFTLLLALYLYLLFEITAAKDSVACSSLTLKNGRTRFRQRGRFVKFMCNVGFIIAGEKYSTCHNGAWDTELPKCVRANCKNVTTPSNGLIYKSHRGAVLNFFCKPGFELRGPNAVYCDGVSWDNKLPSCIPVNTKPAFNCNFESDDLCGWNHDVKHDFDWERGSQQTPSGHLGTGPSSDHTKGEGSTGYYMYIEATSRSLNDTARLISPIYDKINTTVCFEFYYHMHGATTGQLRVYLKKETSSWNLTPERSLFWKSGNHGDQWLHSWNVIGPIDEDFQIVFEGVRGSSYVSDIAIDDVSLIANCSMSSTTTDSDIFTTTDDYYNANLTCANRCVFDYVSLNPNLTDCECDYGCSDKDTCCPDYVAYCVWVTDDYTIKDEFTTAMYETAGLTMEEPEIPWHELHTDSNEIVKQTEDTSSTHLPTTIELRSIPRIIPKQAKKVPPAIKILTTAMLDEVVTIPIKLETEVNTYFAISNKPTSKTQSETDKKPYVHRVKNVDSSKKATVLQEQPTNIKFIVVTVSSIGFVLLVVVASFLLAKRYRYFSCRNLHKVNGSDSQSDVRFLTSDEILNFNLATPDNC